ncbi:winged helix-turn-helix transcriptional regulator [Methanosphaerula subterraneus]|uniref:winged helix-turn-helix transcriptional regulator n=1 Tax=Methanosphaerula subterraneus TaxID=3350244 RepID=UPI003F87F1CD
MGTTVSYHQQNPLRHRGPGITRGEIALELGLAGPSVTRWTQRLIAEGVVTEVRDGRRVYFYPVPGSAGAQTQAVPENS